MTFLHTGFHRRTFLRGPGARATVRRGSDGDRRRPLWLLRRHILPDSAEPLVVLGFLLIAQGLGARRRQAS